jgi:hypothetical protein
VANVPRRQVRSMFRIIAPVVDAHALADERIRWSLLRFASSERGWFLLRLKTRLLRFFLVAMFVGLDSSGRQARRRTIPRPFRNSRNRLQRFPSREKVCNDLLSL